MADDDDDLDRVQRLVNETRQYYLDQEQLYCNMAGADERRIIEDYLSKFCDDHPDRAEVAKEIARKTIDDIAGFRKERAILSIKVADTTLRLELLVGSIKIYAEKAGLEAMSQFAEGVMQSLGLATHEAASETVDYAQVVRRCTADARAVGTSVATVQQLAGDVICLRRETLEAIRKGYLTITFLEAFEKMAEHIANTPRDELVGKFWDEVSEEVAEALKDFVGEEIQAARVKRVIEAVRKIIGARKAGTEPGDTDRMLRLLPMLKEHGDILARFNKSYDKLNALQGKILQDTSIRQEDANGSEIR